MVYMKTFSSVSQKPDGVYEDVLLSQQPDGVYGERG